MKLFSCPSHTPLATLMTVLISGLLSACGQTGPLYMPVRPKLIVVPVAPLAAPTTVAPTTDAAPAVPTRIKPNQQ